MVRPSPRLSKHFIRTGSMSPVERYDPPLFCGLRRDHGHDLLVALAGAEIHRADDSGVDRVVAANADARARMPLRAALADDDVARDDGFAAEMLDTETTAGRIASVAG